MDNAQLTELMAGDPSVKRAMESVFGKSDARMLHTVLTAPVDDVVHQAMLAPISKFGLVKPKNVLRLARPKSFAPPGPVKPTASSPASRPDKPSTLAKPLQLFVPPKPPKIETIKSDEMDLVFTTEITKMDDEQHTVFGWASITEVDGEPVIDRQGDMIEMDELSKAAYEYVVSSRKGGHQHQRDPYDEPLQVSDMIESVVFTPEKIQKMGLPPTTPLGWWVGYKIRDDNIWKSVKNGDITGFSVHGKGRRIPVREG
jgi:Putative phage serine protease XkdF